VRNKMTASLLFFVVIVVVLLNNFNERYQNEELKTAFDAIYEDRLIAESYILGFTDKLHHINEVLNDNQLSDSLKMTTTMGILHEIDTINHLYEATKLTETERKYFLHFTNLTHQMGMDLFAGNYESEQMIIQEALVDLHTLSDIQLEEARKLKVKTSKLFNMGSIAHQFEMIILIVIGLIIQSLLFASRTLKPDPFKQDHNLN